MRVVRSLTWAQLGGLFLASAFVVVGVVWLVIPGKVTTSHTWIPSPYELGELGELDDRAATPGPTTPVETTLEQDCPTWVLESRADATMRELARRQGPGTYLYELEASRVAACDAQSAERRPLALGLIAAGLAIAVTAVLAGRRRGRPVFPARRDGVLEALRDPERWATTCTLCGGTRSQKVPSLAATLNGTAGLCSACERDRTVSIVGFEVGVSFVVTAFGCAVAVATGDTAAASTVIFIGLLLPLLFAQVVPHELGHAAVGRLLGFRIVTVSVGMGRCIAKRRAGLTTWELRSVPVSGWTGVLGTSLGRYRLRYGLMVAAGPAANLLIVLAAYVWEPSPDSIGSVVRMTLIVTAGVALLSSLLPGGVLVRDTPAASDGKQLLRIPRMSDAAVRDEVTRGRVHLAILEAEHEHRAAEVSDEDQAALFEQLVRGGEIDPHAESLWIALLMNLHRFDEARSAARALFERTPVTDPRYGARANLLAWCALLTGDVAPWGEADICSAEAFARDRDDPAVTSPKNPVLIELGDVATGLRLLHQSNRDPLEDHELASNLCYIAIGAWKSGNEDEAIATVDRAALLDPRCALLPRARAVVTGVRS